MSTTTVPFATGQRVTRKCDGKAGTVESVQSFVVEADDTYPASSWAVAVRLDADEQVWSGSENAWEPAVRDSTLSERLDNLNRLMFAALHAAKSDGYQTGRYVSNAPDTGDRAELDAANAASATAQTAMWSAFYDLASDVTLKSGE